MFSSKDTDRMDFAAHGNRVTAGDPPSPCVRNPGPPAPKAIVSGGRPERIVTFFGAVDSDSVRPAIESLLSFANEGDDPVVLHISSPGGCVSSGLSLIDTMRHIQAPVFVVASATVASMGAIILACGEPGYRYALPHCRIMLHETSGRAAGRLQEVQSATRFHRELEREVEDILLETTSLSRPRLRRLLRQERFLSSREALEIGLIDHIL